MKRRTRDMYQGNQISSDQSALGPLYVDNRIPTLYIPLMLTKKERRTLFYIEKSTCTSEKKLKKGKKKKRALERLVRVPEGLRGFSRVRSASLCEGCIIACLVVSSGALGRHWTLATKPLSLYSLHHHTHILPTVCGLFLSFVMRGIFFSFFFYTFNIHYTVYRIYPIKAWYYRTKQKTKKIPILFIFLLFNRNSEILKLRIHLEIIQPRWNFWSYCRWRH